MGNKWAQFAIGVFAAGAVQFGLLVAAGVTSTLILSAGVVGAMGTSAVGLLKQLPQTPWSDEERAAKLGAQKEPA